ncbi:MAG: glycosyltransferase family 2 protein [Chitinophagales bacterium]|nr:glycosyltransferase family 2 protein [Chitinophagales bacterium]
MTELTIVILCYRSEEQVLSFARKVKNIALSLTSNSEIVLVGNYIEGSNDKTKLYIQQLVAEDKIYKSVCKPKEGMMGWDMKEGLQMATGKYLCVIDGDGQFPIESIEKCYKLIKGGNYGLVKTYREKRNDGFYRKTISFVYNNLFSLLYPKIKSKDVNSKPKIFTREVYEQLNLTSDDWFIDTEIMIRLVEIDSNYIEFPIEFYDLQGRASFVKFSAIIEFLRNLIHFRFNRK